MTIKYRLLGKPGSLIEFVEELRKKRKTRVTLSIESGWAMQEEEQVRIMDVMARSGTSSYRVAREYPSISSDQIAFRQFDWEEIVKPKLAEVILAAGIQLESHSIHVDVDGIPFEEYRAEREGNPGPEVR